MGIKLRNLKYFKKGIKERTDEQKMWEMKMFLFWGTVGLCMAFVSMLYTLIFVKFNWQLFGFSIFMACMIPIQYNQYLTVKKQLEQLKQNKMSNEQLLRALGGKRC